MPELPQAQVLVRVQLRHQAPSVLEEVSPFLDRHPLEVIRDDHQELQLERLVVDESGTSAPDPALERLVEMGRVRQGRPRPFPDPTDLPALRLRPEVVREEHQDPDHLRHEPDGPRRGSLELFLQLVEELLLPELRILDVVLVQLVEVGEGPEGLVRGEDRPVIEQAALLPEGGGLDDRFGAGIDGHGVGHSAERWLMRAYRGDRPTFDGDPFAAHERAGSRVAYRVEAVSFPKPRGRPVQCAQESTGTSLRAWGQRG